ncbi:hypothetical protein [Peribacillus sp. SI8-4]|uniref:hypothetical protein n=1 Tax=Peribacillus sp. SI8-4 TaxID=3048009 RepID=UPI0025560690|nr:hypothetical protein [Peribacillus sp. SI8-4]
MSSGDFTMRIVKKSRKKRSGHLQIGSQLAGKKHKGNRCRCPLAFPSRMILNRSI